MCFYVRRACLYEVIKALRGLGGEARQPNGGVRRLVYVRKAYNHVKRG